MTGTAIKTNGIGQQTTAHLNLKVSMADWRGKIVVDHKYPEARVQPPVARRRTSKAPYAGKGIE